MTDTPLGVSVIIPCHNEELSITPTLEQVQAALARIDLPSEIIVVDDASTDQTAEKVDRQRFHLIRHEINRGYGAALKTGATHARYAYLVITDADGTYPNEEIPALVGAIGDVDMVVGARTGPDVNVPLIRRPAKWVITRLANYLSGYHIPDINSGLRVIRRSLWLRYRRYYPDGFSLTTTITLAALINGHRVKYVPINYNHRVGRSKIRPIRDTLNFIQLILRTVLYFDPLKVFVPVAVILFLASALVGGTTLILSYLHIAEFMDVTTILLFESALKMLAIGVLADMIAKRLP